MDHPLIGNERPGSPRRDFAAARRSAYVPPISRDKSAGAGERLERHLATLAPTAAAAASRPAPSHLDVAQATALVREISPRSGPRPDDTAGRRRFSLLAPLRSVRRWFGF